MKPGLFIRSDGNPEIGHGHLIRCLAIARILKDDFEISLIYKQAPPSVVDNFLGCGFNCIHIENEEDFFEKLAVNIFVILDGYLFDMPYQKLIKSKVAKLVCIDDMHENEFVADLILNHSPGVTPQDYNALPYTQYALGLEYVLLRPAFLCQAKKQRRIKNIDTVMICFGGSDPGNLTLPALKTVVEFRQFRKIFVITGAGYQFVDSLKSFFNNEKRVEFNSSVNEQEMIGIMMASSLAVVPASGILFEALSVGCKIISGYSAGNQMNVYKYFRDAGLFYDAANFSGSGLKKALTEVFTNREKGLRIIDGRSPLRIKKLFSQLSNEKQIVLRKAGKDDLELTYSWASNMKVRRYSFQQAQITRGRHSDWFKQKIKDNSCFYFIAEYNKMPIGSIRFDVKKGIALLSYLLDPESHGHGLGQVILKKGIEELLFADRGNRQVKVITGEVMKDNMASIKAFDRLGFTKINQGNNYKFEKWLRENQFQ